MVDLCDALVTIERPISGTFMQMESEVVFLFFLAEQKKSKIGDGAKTVDSLFTWLK